jgi:hypothetical protein
MLSLPFIAFWILMYLGRDELGLKGILISIAIWAAAFFGGIVLSISPYLFVSFQAIFDVILILIIFGGDIKLR